VVRTREIVNTPKIISRVLQEKMVNVGGYTSDISGLWPVLVPMFFVRLGFIFLFR